MKTLLYLSIFFCTLGAQAQEAVFYKLPELTVDDDRKGYTLYTFDVPEDGYYSFILDGSMLPKTQCTIYYCEYQLQLRSERTSYLQEEPNVASQAQDGNICYFGSNDKNNRIGGVFNKGEKVELRLLMLKSDINGQPHKPLNITQNTLVSVSQVTPGYTVK